MSRTTDMVSHNAPQLSSAQTLKRVLHYLRPHKRLALLAFFSALVAVVLSLAVPILIGLGIDTIVGPHQVGWDELGRTLRLLAACVAAVACAQWVQGYATNRLSYEAVRDLRDDAYSKLRVLPMGYIDSHAHGDLSYIFRPGIRHAAAQDAHIHDVAHQPRQFQFAGRLHDQQTHGTQHRQLMVF